MPYAYYRQIIQEYKNFLEKKFQIVYFRTKLVKNKISCLFSNTKLNSKFKSHILANDSRAKFCSSIAFIHEKEFSPSHSVVEW